MSFPFPIDAVLTPSIGPDVICYIESMKISYVNYKVGKRSTPTLLHNYISVREETRYTKPRNVCIFVLNVLYFFIEDSEVRI